MDLDRKVEIHKECITIGCKSLEKGLTEAERNNVQRISIEIHNADSILDIKTIVKHPIVKELIITCWYPEKDAREIHLNPLSELNLRCLLLTSCINPVIDFSKFNTLRELDLYFDKQHTTNLSSLTNLEKLDIRDYKHFPDMREFGTMKKLKRLVMWDTKIETLSGLENCTSLEDIVLARPRRLKDISALTALPHLKKIDITGALVLEDYSPLARITALESIIVENNKVPIHISDLTPNDTIKFFSIKRLASLEGIEKMTALNYALFQELETKDVSPMFLSKSLIGTQFSSQNKMNYTIKQVEEKLQQNINTQIMDLDRKVEIHKECITIGCKSLEKGLTEAERNNVQRISIEIHNADSILDIKTIVKHPIVKELIITCWYPEKDAREIHLNPLSELNLRCLLLTSCINPVIDFSKFNTLRELDLYFDKQHTTNLSSLTNLEKLDIRDYKHFPDMREFGTMKKLKRLVMRDTKIETLSGLENCTSLEEIVLTGPRKLKDISALTALSHLKKINITEASVLEDYSPLARITALESMTVENNKVPIHISDLTPNDSIKFFSIKRLASLEGIEKMTALNHVLFKELETKDVSPMFLSKSLIGIHFSNQDKMNYTIKQVEEKLQQNIK